MQINYEVIWQCGIYRFKQKYPMKFLYGRNAGEGAGHNKKDNIISQLVLESLGK